MRARQNRSGARSVRHTEAKLRSVCPKRLPKKLRNFLEWKIRGNFVGVHLSGLTLLTWTDIFTLRSPFLHAALKSASKHSVTRTSPGPLVTPSISMDGNNISETFQTAGDYIQKNKVVGDSIARY